MNEFIIRAEDFKFKILDKVPIPQNGECILLYKMERGGDGSMVIDSLMKPLSAEIRHSRFDKKITFSLEERMLCHEQKVVMDNNEFYFHVRIKLSYALANVRLYYFNEKTEGETEILQALRQVLKNCNGKWGMKRSSDLEIHLEEELNKSFEQFNGLKFRICELIVRPDEDAELIIKSDKSKMVNIHVGENQTEELVTKNYQSCKVIDSENILYNKNLERMAAMMKNFGALGPIAEEYLKGEKSGEEFYEYILKNKTNNLDFLKAVSESDMLSQDEIFQSASQILSDDKFIQGENEKKLLDKRGEGEKQEYNDKVELCSPSDGDNL